MNKSVTVIGLNDNMKSACILSVEGIDWDWLQENANIAHLINFRHKCTNWSGRDTLDSTLKKGEFSLTGEEIHLEKPIVFTGVDYDMGHEYGWVFNVHWLMRCEKSNVQATDKL